MRTMSSGRDMTRVSKDILRFFETHRIVAQPSTVAHNIDAHPHYVGELMRDLVDEGLLMREGTGETGWYRITEDGIEYVRRNLPY